MYVCVCVCVCVGVQCAACVCMCTVYSVCVCACVQCTAYVCVHVYGVQRVCVHVYSVQHMCVHMYSVQRVCVCAYVQYACVECVCVCTLLLPTLQKMVVFLGVDAGNNIVRCRSISVGGAEGAGPGPWAQVGQHPGQLTLVGVGTWWKWQRQSQFSVTPGGAVRMLSADRQVTSHRLSSGTAWQLQVHFSSHLAVPQAGTDRVHHWPALVLGRVMTVQGAEFLEKE